MPKDVQPKINLSELPLELVDQILKHLDAISLAKSRQVCRSWRALLSQQKYNLFWRSACFRDIGKDVLIELRGDCADSAFSSNVIVWEDVYKEWYRSRHIGKWPFVVTELKGHKGPIWDVKFSGDQVVTSGQDCTIRIWDSWTTHCITTVQAHRDSVSSIALRKSTGLLSSADLPHDLMVSGSRDCLVKVWDLKTLLLTPFHPLTSPSCLVTLHGHTACINCVTVHSNFAASASDDCCVLVWDITKGHCYYEISNLGNWVKFVRLWKDELLLCVTDNNDILLWRVRDKSLSSIAVKDASVDSSCAVTVSGVLGAVLRGKSALILTQHDGLSVWENEQGHLLHNITLNGLHGNNVPRGECLAMRGALVAIGTRSGAVYIYHVDGKWEDQFSKAHCLLHVSKSPITAVALDDDGLGPAVVAAGEDGIVKVYRWFPASAT